MQVAASLLCDQFPVLLSRLPADLDLDRLALDCKAIQRNRNVSAGATVLRLALARGPGGLSLRETAAWAGQNGTAELSNPAVKFRLDRAPAFLEAVLSGVLTDKSVSRTLLLPGRTLRMADGTCISKPGSRGTNWRVHGVYDLGLGGFSHLELSDAKGAESLSRGAPVAGEVRIGDRNYAKPAALRRLRQDCDEHADFIVRLGWNALSLRQSDGGKFDLIGHLAKLPEDTDTHECVVQTPPSPPAIVPQGVV